MATMLNPVRKAAPVAAKGFFDPDDIRVLVAAFEDSWRSLVESGVTFESDRGRNAVRDQLAKYVIEQARHSERDYRRLRDGILLHFAELGLKRKPRR
jgi:hypothetical protein